MEKSRKITIDNDQSNRAGILLIAHGSRLPESNDEIRALGRRLADAVDKPFTDTAETTRRPPIVQHAFLEIGEPSIQTAIDICVHRGVTELFVVPYFLAAGRHVQTDIPHAIESARKRHIHLKIKISPHVGQSGQMLELILAGLDITP